MKRWPVGSVAQSAIQAALQARSQIKDLSKIKQIRVFAEEGAYDHLVKIRQDPWQPISRETADHSLPYIVAAAVLDGVHQGRKLHARRSCATRSGRLSSRRSPCTPALELGLARHGQAQARRDGLPVARRDRARRMARSCAAMRGRSPATTRIRSPTRTSKRSCARTSSRSPARSGRETGVAAVVAGQGEEHARIDRAPRVRRQNRYRQRPGAREMIGRQDSR